MKPAVRTSDLRFLVGALGHGMDPETGLDLFLNWQQQGREANAAVAEPTEIPGLDTLRQQAIELTSGETPISQEDFVTRLEGIAQMHGLPEGAASSIPGLSQLYSSQQPVIPDEDKKNIINAVYLSKDKMDRGDLYRMITGPMRQQVGDAMFAKMKPQIDAIINAAYSGSALPEF